MRISYIDMNNLKRYPLPMCACIGYFDGIHLGHQKLISATSEMAERYHCDSALITFDPDPREVTVKYADVHHIMTLRQKINKAMDLGIDNIYILKFTEEMSKLTPDAFIEMLLKTCDLKGLVCGFDFHYGYKGQGNAETLKACGKFEVAVIEPVSDSGGKISSTRIQQLIRDGDVSTAERLLGSPYEVEGIVVEGHHKGTGIGFPTANLQISTEYVAMHPGVYAGYVWIDRKRYRGMINFGHNPTFNYTNKLSLEIHLLDFEGDLYGKRLRVQFKHFLREERQFKTVGNLIMQLEQDKYAIKRLLSI